MSEQLSAEGREALRALADGLMNLLHPQLDLYGIDATDDAYTQVDDVLALVERHAVARLASRDARLAAVEALAAKWLAERDAPFGEAHMSYAYAQHELHAALHPDPSEAGA